MSDSETTPPPGGALPLDLSNAEIKPARTIPTTEFIRPCERIEPETKEFDGFPTNAGAFGNHAGKVRLAAAGRPNEEQWPECNPRSAQP